MSVKAAEIAPETNLNDYLRNTLHLTGTKSMCYEGGCGSCVVCVQIKDNIYAVNSVSTKTIVKFCSIVNLSRPTVLGVYFLLPRLENLHNRRNRQLKNGISPHPKGTRRVQRYPVWLLLAGDGDEHVRPLPKEHQNRDVRSGEFVLWKYMQVHRVQTDSSGVQIAL